MRSTYEELVILRWLDGAVLGEALDDLGGLVELGFRHDEERGRDGDQR